MIATTVSFSIRQAGPSDAPVVAALAERTFRDTYGAANSDANMASYLAANFGVMRQAAELADPAWRTLLCESGGAPAAYAQLALRPAPPCIRAHAPLEVVRFYVDAPWHGRGLAQALMEALMDTARALGAGGLWLGVWERNARAIAFYRRMGFAEAGSQVFVLGRDRQRDLVLARPLGVSVACSGASS